MAEDERFCAICERTLGEKDSEHVCRSCFRKAREPKRVYVSDRAARNIGTAIAFGNFVNWGLGKLVDAIGVKREIIRGTPEDGARARQRLADIQRRIKEELNGENPDGGPETPRSK